jgi:hypothetical protein
MKSDGTRMAELADDYTFAYGNGNADHDFFVHESIISVVETVDTV